MPLQNRVLPTGEIIAHPARGLFMGNRGRLHDEARRLVRQTCGQRAWICCTLDFKDRRREVMAPRSYTELFFLDEAVALAAGHRPCAECRRPAFKAFAGAWELAHGHRPKAAGMDRAIAGERWGGKGHAGRSASQLRDLPTGTFVRTRTGALGLVADGRLLRYEPMGYGPVIEEPGGDLTLLTPRPIVALLHAYCPQLHPSARTSGNG